MKTCKFMVSIGVLIPFLLVSPVMGAYLPNQTPENQAFSVDTVLDATGMINNDEGLNWVITSPGAIPTGILGDSQRISLLDYSHHFRTNGGKISGNKVFRFDSGDRPDPLSSLEAEKLLTYESVGGAHLEGEEGLSLDVAGNFSSITDNVRCVLMASPSMIVPAFCTKVTAQSYLKSLNSGQVSSKSTARAVAGSIRDPLALSYRIALRPDTNSPYADGTVKTYLSLGNSEARDNKPGTWNKTGSTNTWIDSTMVTGGIKNFLKDFGDPSEFKSGFYISPDDMKDGRSTRTENPVSTKGTLQVIFHHPTAKEGSFTITGPDAWYWGGTIVTSQPKSFSDLVAGKYWVTYTGNGYTQSGWVEPDSVTCVTFSF